MDDSREQFKIVVADDSAVYRKLVENSLAGEQCTLLLAKNGREALALVSAHRPALVITDWQMPDVTGLQLCEQIRHDQDGYTYIIMLTSNSQKDQIVEGLAAGADDYLTKPFHAGELLARFAAGRRIVELHRQIQAKNRILEELALADPLTGLPNRRALEHWAKRELKGAARYGFPFWVVMADIDRFKSVNDTYGHQAGDLVLRGFADLLQANTRVCDICARIGGEEFVLAICHGGSDDILTVTERIRRQLEAETCKFGGSELRVTASFGISGFQGYQAPEFEQLLRDADAALYAAKRGGRNRTEFAAAFFRNSAVVPIS